MTSHISLSSSNLFPLRYSSCTSLSYTKGSRWEILFSERSSICNFYKAESPFMSLDKILWPRYSAVRAVKPSSQFMLEMLLYYSFTCRKLFGKKSFSADTKPVALRSKLTKLLSANILLGLFSHKLWFPSKVRLVRA